MSSVTHGRMSRLFVAAVVIGAGGVLAVPMPVAYAEDVCTVPGEYLNLHLGPQPALGYRASLTVQAAGATIGSSALAKVSPELGTYGKATGSVRGRTVDFTITWDATGTQARFTGTVGEDGIARGTSTGATVPINLWVAGDWESMSPLDCASVATATVTSDVDVYDKKNEPDGAGQVVGILRAGTQVQLAGSCAPSSWCQVSGPNVPGGWGWVWGHLQF